MYGTLYWNTTCLIHKVLTLKCHETVELHTRVIIEFCVQRALPEVGVVIAHVGLDRHKKVLVESCESLPVYFGIVSSRKDYFTLTIVSCDLHNPLGA